MRNFSFDLFFSLQERVKTRERAISLKTRDKISFLIQNRRRQKFCPKDCFFFCSKKNKFRSFDQKFKKTANEFYRTEKTTKKVRRRRSPLGRNSTHHFVVLIYYSPLSLKIKCSRLREEGLPLRNEEDNEDIEAFSEVVLSPLKKKQTTTF